MTTTTATDTTPITLEPLRPRPDQRERWMTHATPLVFEEAAQMILDAHEQDGEREEIIAHDLRTWAFGGTKGTMAIAPIPLPGRERRTAMPVRELAFNQICARLSAPPGYIRSLPGKLQLACVNFGLTSAKQPALLRLAGGELRAVLSDRYAAVDDRQVLEVVGEVLDRGGYLEDARVRALAVGAHTVLRITLPGEGVPVKTGDVIEYGLDIGNSEVGLRSVQVTPVTYRLLCTNGMRAWRSEAALRMRHIGDPKRLREQLRDAVPVAFAEARGDIERWRKATEVLIDDALEEIETLRGLGLSQGEVQAVGRELASTAGLLPSNADVETLNRALGSPTTAFDVANAMTAVARDRADVAARLTLEEQGHRYLSRRTA